MATLIPTTDVDSIDNFGERLLATALKDCFDKKTLVYHSFPWLRPKTLEHSPRTPLQPGEIDFVILHPEYGLLVLEVKGETQLVNLAAKLADAGVAHKLWTEQPENVPTCLATRPCRKDEVQALFKKCNLAKGLVSYT